MNHPLIGLVALNFVTLLYSIYFLPQLWHNARRRQQIQSTQTGTVSWGLHFLYVTAICLDLLYGFGQHLPWQYNSITLFNLCAIGIQHYQLRPRHGRHTAYAYLSTSFALLLGACLFAATMHLKTTWLNTAGFISVACWSCAYLPQLVKNRQQKNAQALSLVFIGLSIIIASLNFIAALYLNWPLPSLICPPIMFLINSISLWQYYHYQPASHRRFTLINNRA